MRSQLPTLELDSVFEAKEELALAVKNALAETMTNYGYQIVQVLITDLDPDQRVKVSFSKIVVIYGTYFPAPEFSCRKESKPDLDFVRHRELFFKCEV